MPEADAVIDSIPSILVTRLDALGDIVLGTALLSGVHARWPGAKIRVVVRPQLGGVAKILPDWVEVLPLPFDPRGPIEGRESEIVGHLQNIAPAIAADLAIIGEYNKVWASEILASMSGAREIISFDSPSALNFHHRDIVGRLPPATGKSTAVPVDAEEGEVVKYLKLLMHLGLDKEIAPGVVVREEDRREAAALWAATGCQPDRVVVCFPSSGEQLVRSLDVPAWSRWIGHLESTHGVVLLGSSPDKPVLDAIKTGSDVARVLVPVERVGLTAAFIELAGFFIGMDTGPMHLAAVLGRPTLGIFGGGHRAQRFLPTGRRAAAARMPLGCYGCDWLCPFERRLCIKNMPEASLHAAGDAFLQGLPENASFLAPRIFQIDKPADLPPDVVLGPIMRQHQQFLKLNHTLIEHHAYLARLNAEQQRKAEDLAASAAVLAQQNHERAEAVTHLAGVLAEMTRQNAARDQAIAHLSTVISEMTHHNLARDDAISHINRTLAAMTLQNEARDRALASIPRRLDPVP